MKQTSLTLDAPIIAQRLTSWMARAFVREIETGEPVTVHFWLGLKPWSHTMESPYAGLVYNDNGWKVTRNGSYIGSRWRDVYMVETEASRFVNVNRLFDLPSQIAKELAAEEPTTREYFEVVGSIRRALASRPWGFNRTFHAPMGWECPQRIADTLAKLREIDAHERAHPDTTPVCAFSGYRAQRDASPVSVEETAAFLAAEREQLGVDRVAGTVRPGCP